MGIVLFLLLAALGTVALAEVLALLARALWWLLRAPLRLLWSLLGWLLVGGVVVVCLITGVWVLVLPALIVAFPLFLIAAAVARRR